MPNSNAVESNSPISSVPISLYRELCTELRHKNAELDATEQQNQLLLQQNQQLRQELHQLVQRVMQTQQAVTQMTPDNNLGSNLGSNLGKDSVRGDAPLPARSPHRRAMRSLQHQPIPMAIPVAANPAIGEPMPQTQLQLQPQMEPLPTARTSQSPEWITATPEPLTTRLWNQTSTLTQDLQGWKLAVMMGLIIVSAFGAGFLIVRPFMAQQQQQQQLKPAQPLQPQSLQPQTPRR
jgi:hypothetical protein